MPENNLNGKVALVTGSSTGLGLAIAKELGHRGAKVALNYARNHERADAAFAGFQNAGLEGTMIGADVCDPDDVAELVAATES